MSEGHSEIGWVSGSLQPPTEAAHPASVLGEPLWPDTPHIRKGGDWRREELRKVEHTLGRAVVIGECLAPDYELRANVERVLETGQAASMTTMPGSYSSVVIGKNGTHFIGDAASQHPLYMRPMNNEGVLFATHTKPFRSGPNAAPPDRLSLALGVGMPWVHELTAGRTAVTGVSATLPQESIYIDHRGRMTTAAHNSIVPSQPLTFEEAAERLRAALQIGAKRRLENGRAVSADFSGGYDSTSVAYITASAMESPLTIVTQHSPDIPLDDIEYVKTYLASPISQGKFNAHIYKVLAADSMYKDISTVPPGDLPDISIRDRANNLRYYHFLRSLKSELHLTGVVADALVDMAPQEYLGHFARPATFPRFLYTALRVARAEKDSLRNVLSDSRLLHALDPKSKLMALAYMLTMPGKYNTNLVNAICGIGTAPNWLAPAMRKEVAEYAADRADTARVPDGMGLADYRAYSGLLAMGLAQHGSSQTAASVGMRSSTMYLDNDVLKACFGVPAHKRMDPWTFKKLMRHAIGDIVPPELTSRTTKGNYTRHGYQGLRGSREQLQALMKNSRLADLGIIDPKKVWSALESGFMGAPMPWASLDMLLASEKWLRALTNESWDKSCYSAPPPPVTDKKVEVPTTPLDDQATYGMPPGVIIACRNTGGSVLNIPTGKNLRVNTHSLSMLRALEAGGTLADAYSQLAEMYPHMDPDVLRQTADWYVRDLVAKGIVVPGGNEFALLESNLDKGAPLPAQMVYETDTTPNVRALDYAAALGGFALGRFIEREKNFSTQIQLMSTIRSRLARRPATTAEATRMLAACRRVTSFSLGRAACLELSRAAVLGSALRGRYVHLTLGVLTDPEGAHVWPETSDGTPIRTDADEYIKGVYQPLVRL